MLIFTLSAARFMIRPGNVIAPDSATKKNTSTNPFDLIKVG